MIKLRNLVFLIGFFILLIAALAVGGQALRTHDKDRRPIHTAVTPETHSSATHEIHETSSHESHDIIHPRTDLDALAIADIHHVADRQFPGAIELPHTFHARHDWESEWELRWIDYRVSNHLVRVYHAAHKHDFGLRFTSVLHEGESHYESWQPIQ